MIKDGMQVIRDLVDQAAEGDPIKQAVDRLNDKYMVVNENGKVVVYAPRKDEQMGGRTVYDRMKPADLKLLYANQKVFVTDPEGNTKVLDPVTLWLQHKGRRQFIDGVVFDPTGTAGPGYLNLWQGFAVQPVAGDWSLMKRHIYENLCRGNFNYFTYVMGWMAFLVQHPERQAEVAMVLRGPEGCGKGILGRALKYAFGQHGAHITSAKHLVGQFNVHLRDCVFLFADEAFFAGDKAHTGVLKGIITEPTLTVEGKYQNAVEVPNRLHIMMASNERWVIPASLEARRFFVLDCSDTHRNDQEYFRAIQQQLDSGGYQAMLHELLHLDLSRLDIRHPPRTEGLQEQQKLSLPTESSWWLDVLHRGFVYQSRHGTAWLGEWHDRMTTDLLYASYLTFAERANERRPLAREAFGMFMSDMGYRWRRLTDEPIAEVPPGVLMRKARPTGYLLGSLDEARAIFVKHTGLAVEWAEDAALMAELKEEGFTLESAP